MNTKRNGGGSLKISQKVLCGIAGAAAMETEGVAGLAQGPVDLQELFHQGTPGSSVRLFLSDDVATVDVYVKLKACAKVSAVAEKIQKNVKQSIQNMTGVAVSKVNVHVAGIVFDACTE